MSWTTHPEDELRCGERPGPVGPDELVARLLHEGNSGPAEPYLDRFMKSELLPPKDGDISNRCGDSHGFSVDRCSSLTDDEIRSRARAQAEKKPGRESRGACVAKASDLRAIRMQGAPDRQVVFAYDDPIPKENPEHSVLRVWEKLPRTDFDDIRQKIRTAFGRSVGAQPASSQ